MEDVSILLSIGGRHSVTDAVYLKETQPPKYYFNLTLTLAILEKPPEGGFSNMAAG